MVEIGTALDNSAAEMTARFIIGDADIEADWDDSPAEFERIGLGRYIQLMHVNSTVSDNRQYSWWVKKAENDIRLIKVRPRNRKNRHIS